MHKRTLAAIALATLLAACAGTGARESTDPLVLIGIEKQSSTAGGDCMVNVTLVNRVRDTAWDGASYHLSLLNRSGKAAGRLMGAPRKPVAYGSELHDSGRVLGLRCEDITGAELVYMGYYPAGKTQQNVHINRVRVSVK